MSSVPGTRYQLPESGPDDLDDEDEQPSASGADLPDPDPALSPSQLPPQSLSQRPLAFNPSSSKHRVSADSSDVDSQSTARVLTLNCWVVDEGHQRIFQIKIENTQNVTDFRERVKEKKAIAFERVDANNIDLWRVSAPIEFTSELPEHVRNSGILTKESLPPMALLSDIFPEPLVKNNLHVVVQAESGNQ